MWIRQTRKELGVSQRALADAAGLSRSYLCDIERGRGTQPSVTTLDKLAEALGASRSELLRAAGVIEQPVEPRHTEVERKLLAVLRDLSEAGQRDVVRYARFVHADEHHLVQTELLPMQEVPTGTGNVKATGPLLFSLDGEW
jgi:transcriptional regulator with XRE-family HTH domain